MRGWLNDEFYQAAFSKEEQERILEVTYQNEDDGNDGIDCGDATCDKVSLLSLKGFYEYFELEDGTYKPEMRVKPTEYAMAQGGSVYSEAEWGLSGTTEYDGNGYWWLRTVVVDNTYAVKVSSFGAGGYSAVHLGDNVVRPVICVKP